MLSAEDCRWGKIILSTYSSCNFGWNHGTGSKMMKYLRNKHPKPCYKIFKLLFCVDNHRIIYTLNYVLLVGFKDQNKNNNIRSYNIEYYFFGD
jgi:hypothetical protein